MANILQVGNSPIDTNSIQIQNGGVQTGLGNGAGASPQVGAPGAANVQNIPQQPGQAGQSQAVNGQEQNGAIPASANFESNYAAFVRGMQDSLNLPDELAQILFRDGEAIVRSQDPELTPILNNLFSSITAEDPQQLLQMMEDQNAGQAKFSGELFDGIRNLLNQPNLSEPERDAILQFLKSYNNYASGEHYLTQMQTVAEDVDQLMSRPVQGEFEDLLSQVNWKASNGDTAANARVINEQIIPFMARYVARTHDYGAVRKAAVLFSLYSVKYENGAKSQLLKLFSGLSRYGKFRAAFDDEPEMALSKALQNLDGKKNPAGKVSDSLAQLLQKGVEGKTGNESIERYSSVLNSMLANESVYMPLLHMLMPFRFQGKNVMSEMWVDPDAEKDKGRKGGGSAPRKVKMYLKFNIEDLGDFDLIAMVQDKDVEMQLFMPPTVPEKPDKVAGAIGDIIKANDLNLAGLSLAPKTRDLGLTEVFPEIRTNNPGVNIRV